jgi:hypothetical protein
MSSVRQSRTQSRTQSRPGRAMAKHLTLVSSTLRIGQSGFAQVLVAQKKFALRHRPNDLTLI